MCDPELRYTPSGNRKHDGSPQAALPSGALAVVTPGWKPGMLLNILLCPETLPPPPHPAQCQ